MQILRSTAVRLSKAATPTRLAPCTRSSTIARSTRRAGEFQALGLTPPHLLTTHLRLGLLLATCTLTSVAHRLLTLRAALGTAAKTTKRRGTTSGAPRSNSRPRMAHASGGTSTTRGHVTVRAGRRHRAGRHATWTRHARQRGRSNGLRERTYMHTAALWLAYSSSAACCRGGVSCAALTTSACTRVLPMS